MLPLWGIDLGGTKIEGVVLENSESLKPIVRYRLPTEGDKGYIHVLRQIFKLVEILGSEVGMRPSTIGICTPGTIDRETQLLKNSNTVALNGKKFKHDLENLINIPIKVSNDANCFAIAETLLGAVPEEVPDAKVVFGIILGTGVGGGLVVNGKIIEGRHGIGGEWGHNALVPNGEICYCGKRGCVETVIAGPSLQRHYTSLTGQTLPLKEIVDRHRKGIDEAASQTMGLLMIQFGLAVSTIINTIDPDAIVIGGGVGNIDELYTDGVEAAKSYVFNDQLHTKFLKPKLGDSAGVFGAALL